MKNRLTAWARRVAGAAVVAGMTASTGVSANDFDRTPFDGFKDFAGHYLAYSADDRLCRIFSAANWDAYARKAKPDARDLDLVSFFDWKKIPVLPMDNIGDRTHIWVSGDFDPTNDGQTYTALLTKNHISYQPVQYVALIDVPLASLEAEDRTQSLFKLAKGHYVDKISPDSRLSKEYYSSARYRVRNLPPDAIVSTYPPPNNSLGRAVRFPSVRLITTAFRYMGRTLYISRKLLVPQGFKPSMSNLDRLAYLNRIYQTTNAVSAMIFAYPGGGEIEEICLYTALPLAGS